MGGRVSTLLLAVVGGEGVPDRGAFTESVVFGRREREGG